MIAQALQALCITSWSSCRPIPFIFNQHGSQQGSLYESDDISHWAPPKGSKLTLVAPCNTSRQQQCRNGLASWQWYSMHLAAHYQQAHRYVGPVWGCLSILTERKTRIKGRIGAACSVSSRFSSKDLHGGKEESQACTCRERSTA